MIDPPTAFVLIGLLYIALPATAWTILHNRHDAASVALWCGGALLYGTGFILIGTRSVLPAWLSFLTANLLVLGSYVFRVMAMRRELSARGGNVALGLAWIAFSVAYGLAYTFASRDAPRILVAVLGNLAGAGGLAWLAWLLYRRTGYRSAAMIAGAYGLMAAALVVRVLVMFATWNDVRALGGGPDVMVLMLTGVIAALYGTLGYIGVALDMTRAKEIASTAHRAREDERLAQSALRIREQSDLLAERGRLLAQHEEMLSALAHEVRQPLNNASAAIQSTLQLLKGSGANEQSAATRLQRANAVLMQVTGSLDNALTDAVLLGPDAAFERQDIDIDTLVNLAIADVDPTQRDRVRCERTTATRTASMNAGLMRLALRNVIANALAYTPAGSPVTVRIADSDEPLALVIDVCDEGDGIPPELLVRLFARGARGRRTDGPPGHGLGLSIVRRILEMHQGEASVVRNGPGGLTLRLLVPQGVA
jgi:signal transduction histidine kinase